MRACQFPFRKRIEKLLFLGVYSGLLRYCLPLLPVLGNKTGQQSISMDNNLMAYRCLIELVSGVFAQLVLAMVFKTIGGFEQSSQWVQFPYIPALQSALDTELRTSKGISICHGLARNYTEKTEAETRKRNPPFRAGCVSDGSFLRRRTQLFIAYLYKPEVDKINIPAQAKVFQMSVYYSHIIPSLALQACKTRDPVKSRFPNPPLIADKRARPLRQAQGPGFLYGQ